MKIRFKKSHPDAQIIQPRSGDAGYDLCSPETIKIGSLNFLLHITGNEAKIKTGISIEIPDSHVGLIRDRSSFGAKGIIVCGGVIDSQYRGEIIVCLRNISPDHYTIKKGDKIAQLLIIPHITPELIESDELNQTERGEGGFGSTGA